MSFHASADNVRLNDSTLYAVLSNADGEPVEASIDLNSIIGNDDGAFSWGGGDFSASAENISLNFEGEESLPILRAQLRTVDGDLVDANLNLSERLGNENGSFVFI